MQPGQTSAPSTLEPDDPLDGRDTLRLVRIRLVLTLLAVGIVPAALVAPVVRTLADESRVEHRTALGADARFVSTSIGTELDELGTDLAAIARLAPMQAALSDPAAVEAASSEFVARFVPGAPVTGYALVDGAGTVVTAAGAATWPEPVVESSFSPLAGGAPWRGRVVLAGDEAATLIVSVPLSGGADLGGWVAARVDLGRLLVAVAPAATIPGRTLELRDAAGHPLAVAGEDLDAAGLTGAVLDLATDASRGTAGIAPLVVPGLPAWQLVASAPLTVTELSPLFLVGLAVLLGLLLWLVIWMARSILRPAARLEASRGRLRELYESAREAALRDSLTGLGNHRAFQEQAARLVDASRRYGTPFGLILFDIDEFKRINDTRGHAVGDELLATVGELIRSTTRQADAGYRIGGDEFAVLLTHTDAAGTETLARRLLSRALEERPTGAFRGPISFSAGVTACPEFAVDRADLHAQADAALYRGKRSGRTMVTVYDPTQDRGHIDERMRAELSAAVSVVIETNALSPVYQPIVHLESGRTLGYEGLVRVRQDAGFAHTGALFDAAEVAGRVLDLDRAALDVVLRGATAIAEPTLISLNVSPRSFEAPEFNATVFLAILRRHGIPPERVILELTERDAVRDVERLRSVIVALQAAGVRVAADDVGAGNAGLRLLSQFRFDVVKIDLSLVQGGAGQDQTLTVLTSLAGLAARWGALTIAEGVETPAQLRVIRRLGIDAGQGYLLGRPSIDTSLEWLDLDDLARRDGTVERPSSPPAAIPARQPQPAAEMVASALLKTSKVSNE
jgi:diguanylate cyclase (GGDEF)-like protein